VHFASLESARRAAVDALRRFPFPLACAWAAGAISCALVAHAHDHRGWIGALLAASLGIPFGIALTLLAERLETPAAPRTAARVALFGLGLAAVALFALLSPHWTTEIEARRFVQFALFAHALVAFLPYMVVREPNGFWQFNRTMLERLIVASVFAGVLQVGLQGALFALKPLFGFAVPPKVYAYLAISVGFVFHPWFFLAGIPRDLGELESRRDYPAVIRIFAQFILVPLVAIYQILLTAYLARVIVTQQWPSGLIGWLVSAEAGAGLLAILLVHPVREQNENRWVRTFARVFFVALIPSIVMLALAIAKRVGQYGVTEDRYFVTVLTAWLAGISVYFIARRDGDIRWIPVTLAALALLTAAGPWGAYAVSRASQLGRLQGLLRANGMLVDGSVRPATGSIPFAASKDLSTTLGYLLSVQGDGGVKPLLATELAALDASVKLPHLEDASSRARRLARQLNFGYVESWERQTHGEFTYSTSYSERPEADWIGGFDYHVRVNFTLPQAFTISGRAFELRAASAPARIVLLAPPDTLGAFPLDSLIAAGHFGPARSAHPTEVSLDLEGGAARGRLDVTQSTGSDSPELRVTNLVADLFFTPPAAPAAAAQDSTAAQDSSAVSGAAH